MRRVSIALIAALLFACQTERWGVPSALRGFPTGSHNYSQWGSEPPRVLSLYPLMAADTSGCLHPPLPLSSRLTVLATTHGSLIGVSTSEPLWSFRFPDSSTAAVPLVADSTTVYALSTDGVLYALSFEGTVQWERKLFPALARGGGPYLPLLPLPHGVVAGDASGHLVRVSAKGEILWERRYGGSLSRGLSANAEGVLVTAVAADGGDSVLVLDSAGQQRWSRLLAQTQLSCPAAVSNRRVFVAGVRQGEPDPIPVLHCFSVSGELIWSQSLPAVPRWLSLDDSSRLYVVVHSVGIGEPISGLLVYGADGRQRWKLYVRSTIVAPALLFREALLVLATGADGSLGAYILSTRDGSLQEFLSLEEAPPLVLWPAVTPDGDILLGWSTRLGLLRLGEHPWKWLLF